MATNNFNNFDIPKEGYVAFDAMSLRQLILDRLNKQNVFTDQNFVGSNLASIIDIVAYSYNTLIYYLNRTASESMFTEAQIYENINRIVKILDYNPLGFQTSTLSISATVDTLAKDIYTIPRYSYISVNGISFSFNEEITFVKNLSATTEVLDDINSQKLMYQGTYREYPLYTSTGENNEFVLLNVPTNVIIDHFNIDVYVKSVSDNKWRQYTKTVSLYLENSSEEKYEIRLNSDKQYEITFGDDINGKKLQEGDQVIVYYLESSGESGVVGQNAFKKANLSAPSGLTNYSNVMSDVLDNKYFNLLNGSGISNIHISNVTASTPTQSEETPDQIRKSAPSAFRSQYRLVNEEDYNSFVRTNFTNLIADVKVVNNWVYTTEYLQYFYNIGLTDPALQGRALFNQIQFADSCNFNNVYFIIVPKTTDNKTLSYLLPAQKELISTTIQDLKCLTTEVSYIDPVYKAIALGIYGVGKTFNVSDEYNTKLYIKRKISSRRDDKSIINDIINVFRTYFSKSNLSLGQIVDVKLISQKILEVEGVETFYTGRIDDDTLFEGLSLFVWNPDYPVADKSQTSNNISFKSFEYPYLYDYDTLLNKISIYNTKTLKSFSGY